MFTYERMPFAEIGTAYDYITCSNFLYFQGEKRWGHERSHYSTYKIFYLLLTNASYTLKIVPLRACQNSAKCSV
jgi:hypothetical protein